MLTREDFHYLNEGTHARLYNALGAHPSSRNGEAGVHFAAWAPNAARVSVVGDFNGWKTEASPLEAQGSSGVWAGFLERVAQGTRYKYHVVSQHGEFEVDKADPFGFAAEESPNTASVVCDLGYRWGDADWMASRGGRNGHDSPISIYEMHLGSWARNAEKAGRRDSWLSYRELAPLLADYLIERGFTHVEFLPVMEHPFYGSWGYQTLGYFAPTSRYGAPQDFMYLIDTLHQAGLGVILDWVPSHFPSDEHGLVYFDGTHLFEHSDPRQGFHPDWDSYIFNYGRNEVRSFLTSSAFFWLDKYHVDGLRVDAVASMLYLDYSRSDGEWVPNRFGGRENLEAISFLRSLNEAIYREFPDVQIMAEESTAWPMVSKPTYVGGLGFGMKWDMGWMHDSLDYMSREPVHRKFHHGTLTFRMIYAFNENFVLPLSHDEVVYGKRSLFEKMPGDDWQKRANLRLLYGYMFAQPGKKLLFMGGEFGQRAEWDHESQLEWRRLDDPAHAGIAKWLSDLNRAYKDEPALHAFDCDPSGFEWIDASDSEQSVVSFLRKAADAEPVVVACNFTPLPRANYLVGVPLSGRWREILNSDSKDYAGSGQGNFGGVDANPVAVHGRPYSVTLVLPPLGVVFLKHERAGS